jgi:hypothetical protein
VDKPSLTSLNTALATEAIREFRTTTEVLAAETEITASQLAALQAALTADLPSASEYVLKDALPELGLR